MAAGALPAVSHASFGFAALGSGDAFGLAFSAVRDQVAT